MTGAGTLYAWEFERGGQALAVRVSGPLAFNEPDLMLGAALDGLGACPAHRCDGAAEGRRRRSTATASAR